VGFDAAVGNEAIKVRWTRGLPAYLIGVIKTVFLYYNPAQVEIILDGSETIKQVSLMISVMNGRRMGGGFQMAPDSRPDDGLFDLCIAETASKGRILQMIPHFIRGTQASLPEIQMKRAKSVEIKSLDLTFPAHADGEFICLNGSHLTLEILPSELEIICA
jgi:diacylglycerol kinase family enzyme